jgi:hypothetical protein
MILSLGMILSLSMIHTCHIMVDKRLVGTLDSSVYSGQPFPSRHFQSILQVFRCRLPCRRLRFHPAKISSPRRPKCRPSHRVTLPAESSEAGLLAAFSTSADPLTQPESSSDSPESTSGSSVAPTDLSHPSTKSTEKINFTLLLNLVAAVQNVVLLQGFRQPAPMSLAKAAVFCRSRGRKALTLDFLS